MSTIAAKVGRLRIVTSKKLTPAIRAQIARVDRLYKIKQRARALREMGAL